MMGGAILGNGQHLASHSRDVSGWTERLYEPTSQSQVGRQSTTRRIRSKKTPVIEQRPMLPPHPGMHALDCLRVEGSRRTGLSWMRRGLKRRARPAPRAAWYRKTLWRRFRGRFGPGGQGAVSVSN